MERLLEACLQRADAVEAALRIYYGSVPLVALVAFLPSRHCLLLRSLVLKVVLRGKLHRESPQTSAPPRWPLHQLISRAWEWSVPQSFFSHFYLLGFFWNLSVIVCLLQDQSNDHLNVHCGPEGWLLLLLLQVHLARRAYESLIVSTYRKQARMHILGYLLALSYYILISTVFLLHGHREKTTRLRHLGVCHLVGCCLFLWGSWHQHKCHLILASLRDSRHLEAAAQENEKVYRVPYGDWFYYVSCPHYTAEVVIYIGFLASSGCGDVTLYLLLAFVFANLIIVAVPTHAWYRQTFESYPKKRTAMIPYYL